MPESKHTPGPWEVFQHLDGRPIWRVLGNEQTVRIAETWNEANARLVAAAPDLLGVYEAAKELWDAPHVVNLGPDFWAVEHPLGCRDMVNCEFNVQMQDLAHSANGPPQEPGAYEMVIDQNEPFDLRLDPYHGVRNRDRLRDALGRAIERTGKAEEAP